MNSLHTPPSFSPLWTTLFLLAIVASFLVVNGLIIWAVWRAVKKPVPPAAGGTPASRGTGRTLAIVAGVLLLCLAVPAVPVLIAIVLTAVSRTSSAAHRADELRQQAVLAQQVAQQQALARQAEFPVPPSTFGAAAEPLETRVLPLRYAPAGDIQATLRQQREAWLTLETRTNSLLLTAKPARLDELQAVIAQLDTAGPEGRQTSTTPAPTSLSVRWPREAGPLETRVFPLARARAADLRTALGPLGGMQNGGSVSVDTRTNALVITASPGYLEQFRLLIEFLDRPLPEEDAHGPAEHGHGPEAPIAPSADPAQVPAPAVPPPPASDPHLPSPPDSHGPATRPPAPPTRGSVEAAQRAVLEAQLHAAQAEVARLQAWFSAGLATAAELQTATHRLAEIQAQLAGDPVKVAEVKLQAAKDDLELIRLRTDAGVQDESALAQARSAVEVREAELRLAQAAAALRVGAPATPAPPLPAASPATLAEIAAAARLNFDASRLSTLTTIAQRTSLTPAEQAALAQAALTHLDFESAKLALLSELIKNPAFSDEAKKTILENLDRLQFEASRISVIEQLNRKPAPHGH